jgi:hypothetical protein
MLAAAGSTERLGKHWTTYFIQRNPSLKAFRGKSMEKSRVEAVTPDKIKAFFATLDEPLVKAIRPQNRWNVDETGIMEGQGREKTVIGPSNQKQAIVKTQKRSNWTSIIECISPEGNYLPPVVIFSGKAVQQQWYSRDPKKLEKFKPWRFICSDNGYTSNDIGLEWLQKVFIPLTNPRGKDWRLLILDGHESHISDAFMLACQQNKIWLRPLVPHSSHVTQPLDVGVFSSLKIHYRNNTDDIALLSNADSLLKEDFLECYYKARETAMTSRNIRSGWKLTGLWPVDAQMVLTSPRLLPPPPDISPEPKITTPTKIQGLDYFKTPKGGAEVRKCVDKLRVGSSLNQRDQQQLLRKVSKALDTKNAKLADQERKIASLQQLVKRLQPKRRTKVVPSAGERFVMLPDIIKAQEKADRLLRLQNTNDSIDIAGFDEIYN